MQFFFNDIHLEFEAIHTRTSIFAFLLLEGGSPTKKKCMLLNFILNNIND